MCPACLTTVALILSGATSTGTLSALALRKRRTKTDAKRFNSTPQPLEMQMNLPTIHGWFSHPR
jgi:hypothetical protein